MTDQELIIRALIARTKAYAPYSGFAVGAALLGEDGRVYTGCNIENAGFSSTVCAERTAFFKAVSRGTRRFLRIAVCGFSGREPEAVCTPCGVCRQVMAEFCDPDRFEIICCGGKTYAGHCPSEALSSEIINLQDAVRLLKSGYATESGAQRSGIQAAEQGRPHAIRAENDLLFPLDFENSLPEAVYAVKYTLRTLFPCGFTGKNLQ